MTGRREWGYEAGRGVLWRDEGERGGWGDGVEEHEGQEEKEGADLYVRNLDRSTK